MKSIRESLCFLSRSSWFHVAQIASQNQWFPNRIDGALQAVGECEREEEGWKERRLRVEMKER